MKESWNLVMEGLRSQPGAKRERGLWSPGSKWERAYGRRPSKLPSRSLGSSAQNWQLKGPGLQG